MKLEQVVYVAERGSNKKSYSSFVRKESNIELVGEIDKSTFSDFGFLLNGISSKELEIGEKIRKIGGFLNDFVINQRGSMYQKEITQTKADFKVLGGKQIGRYYIKPDVKGYISKKIVEDQKAFVKENSILAQNIVAHIENPKDHIQIIASLAKTIPKNFIVLDTINQLQNKSNLSSEFLISVLNSKLVAWYAYRFIFGKAIRTMHFDSPVTERIPLPKLDLSNKEDRKAHDALTELVKQLIDLQKRLNEEKLTTSEQEKINRQIEEKEWEIDQNVYNLYGLNEEEKKIIEESLK